MKKITLYLILFCMIAASDLLHAQEGINASGANITGANGNASYSVGQLVCSTYSGTTGSALEGVQLPFEISFISSLKDVKDISLSWSVYPNPASEFLILKLNDSNLLTGSTLIYQLLDVSGKLMLENRITDFTTRIPVQKLKSSTYFLKINQNKTEKVTYKIIKN